MREPERDIVRIEHIELQLLRIYRMKFYQR